MQFVFYFKGFNTFSVFEYFRITAFDREFLVYPTRNDSDTDTSIHISVDIHTFVEQ